MVLSTDWHTKIAVRVSLTFKKLINVKRLAYSHQNFNLSLTFHRLQGRMSLSVILVLWFGYIYHESWGGGCPFARLSGYYLPSYMQV
jgi:hypothetical protein